MQGIQRKQQEPSQAALPGPVSLFIAWAMVRYWYNKGVSAVESCKQMLQHNMPWNGLQSAGNWIFFLARGTVFLCHCVGWWMDLCGLPCRTDRDVWWTGCCHGCQLRHPRAATETPGLDAPLQGRVHSDGRGKEVSATGEERLAERLLQAGLKDAAIREHEQRW